MATIQGKQKTPQENLIGKTLCNDEYYIHRVIGHGGMGKVYLAAHTELIVPVALKQARADQPLPEIAITELDALLQGATHQAPAFSLQDVPESGGVHTDRFLREALFLARLHHPALPSLYDYFFEDGYWYLVMDYIPGPTLTAYLRQQGPLPPLEALNYAIQLCDVFDYLHKQSPPIIYRDLKPSNILVTPEGTLMLVDFGIARYFKEGQSNDTTDFGSPGYASPEQYQAEGQTDGRSDLFSLGILLYEMISGQRPIAANGVTAAEVSRKDMPPLSATLSGLITLATRTEPMYRFQSAHTFFLALERAYTIEEQRTYQQRVMLEQAMDAVNESDPTLSLSKGTVNEGRAEAVPPDGEVLSGENAPSPEGASVNPLDAAERQKIRETLQQMRRERREDDELETELATVDELLGQRASIELSQFTLPVVSDSEVPTPLRPFKFTVRRIIRTSFVVVLVLCLLLASLLFVARVIHHLPIIPQSQQATATKSPNTSITVAITSIVATSGSWQQLPSLPSAQADNTAAYVRVQGRAYLYLNGGYRGAKASPHYDRHLYRYDLAAAHWETSANTQFPGMVNNAVAIDTSGRLFYTAGYSTNTYAVSSLLYMYQPSSDTTQKIIPPAQVTLGFGGSIVADTQGHLYITQGFTQSGDAQQAGTGWYRYDIATGQWHVLSPLPAGLGYVVLAAESDTSIALIGGATDAGQHKQTNAVYKYDTTSNVWEQATTNAPIALSGAASCVVRSGQIAIIGGYDPTHNKGLDQAWLVDVHTMKWTPLTHLPTGGSVLGAAASDGQGHVFLVRGASDLSQPTSDFWELTIH